MQGTLPDVEDLSTDLARFGHSAVLLPLPSTNRNSAGLASCYLLLKRRILRIVSRNVREMS